jgi:hypothetical protein
MLRKLSYGELLKSRAIAQSMEMSDESGHAKGKMIINLDGVAIFDFARSITEHNLEGDNGLLNFQNAADVLNLDPIIAQEIEKYISALNENPVETDVPFDSKSAKQSETPELKSVQT